MANDRSYLYSVKEIILNYNRYEAKNKAIREAGQVAYDKQIKKAKNLHDSNVSHLTYKLRNEYGRRYNIIPWIIYGIIILTFIIGTFTFLKDVFSYNLFERAAERPNLVMGCFEEIIGDLKAEQLVNNSHFKAGCIRTFGASFFLLFAIAIFLSFCIYQRPFPDFSLKAFKEETPVELIYFTLMILIFLGTNITTLIMDSEVGFIIGILFFILEIVSSIPFAFTISSVYTILLLLILLYYPICKAINESGGNRYVRRHKKEFAALEEENQKTQILFKNKGQEMKNDIEKGITPNPYASQYNAIPGYLRNLSTVNSIIWAIENGYAYDIVSARNYLDRKAQDRAIQQKLAAIQAQANQATQAAYDAAYKAEQAKRAAEAPVEVTIRKY